MPPRFHSFVIWFLTGTALTLSASPVALKSVEATFYQGEPGDLEKTIDGIEASGRGWSVAPRTDEPQAIIFKAGAPLKADLLRLVLCFQSGRAHGSMAEFALSFTSDPQPSLGGKWQPLSIVSAAATTGALVLTEDQHLRAEEVVAVTTGRIPDNNYQVVVRATGHEVTGFRIDVFPVRRTLPQLLPEVRDVPVMAWAMIGDFVLTEFRATIVTSSTNVALGAPVKASHPLYQTSTPIQVMTPLALTDGLPSTFAHPRQPDLGSLFYFEIDLGRSRSIDHLSLWGRNDGLKKEDRMSRLLVRLYENDPESGALPVWQGMDRADGSHPLRGEVDVLRADGGKGRFRGRFIRLSSDSPVPLSPQIAEVEVYPRLRFSVTSLRADGREIRIADVVTIPPKTFRVALDLHVIEEEQARETPFRWRLRKEGGEWLVAEGRTLEMQCPSAGDYVFEAQASHSDGIWDGEVFALPLKVRAPFTQTTAFLGLLAGCTLSAGLLIAWFVSHRRIAALEAQSVLAAERTRIARDMHDDVGARLSQLSFLLKAFERAPSLSEFLRHEVSRISETASMALGSLDEVVWTVNPKNDTLESLARFLGQHATKYLGSVGIALRIIAPPAWPGHVVSAQTRHDLVMAVKEALQNVVKHSAASEVVLTLALVDGDFVVGVADDGRGLPEEQAACERSGLANMKARLEGLGGSVRIRRRPQGGAEVILRAPVNLH